MRYLILSLLLIGFRFCLAQDETDPVYFDKEARLAKLEARRKAREVETQLAKTRFQNPDYQPSNRAPSSKNYAYRYWDRSYARATAPRLSAGIGYGIPSWYSGYGYRSFYANDPFYDPWYCQRGYWGLNSWNSIGANAHIGWSYGSMFYDPWTYYDPYSFGFYHPYGTSFTYFNPYTRFYSRPSFVPRTRARVPEAPRVNTSPNTIRRPASTYNNNFNNNNNTPSFRPSPTFTPSNMRGNGGGGGSGTHRGGTGGGGNVPSPGIRRSR